MCKNMPINNSKLTPNMELLRDGRTQLFRTKHGQRFFLHRANAEVIITPPRPELYAKLIDGVWYWVNGCEECNGRTRNNWKSYIECEKHDRCDTCSVLAKDLTTAKWGSTEGWQCQRCHERKYKETRNAAFQRAADEGLEWIDHTNEDKVVCPHCFSSYEPDDGAPEGEEECNTCGGRYDVSHDISISYSTEIIGEKETPD